MKRFINLTGQITPDGDLKFAWWDTVRDVFEEHAGEQTWDSWEDFEQDYEGDDLGRYHSLFTGSMESLKAKVGKHPVTKSAFSLEYFQTTPPEEMLDDAVGLLRSIEDGNACLTVDDKWCLTHSARHPCEHADAQMFVQQYDYFSANYSTGEKA